MLMIIHDSVYWPHTLEILFIPKANELLNFFCNRERGFIILDNLLIYFGACSFSTKDLFFFKTLSGILNTPPPATANRGAH